MSKVAFITGITGQDGSHLADLLISKDYTVHGIIRRASSFNTGRIDHLYDRHNGTKLFLHYGDLSDGSNLMYRIRDITPDEIYNLGAMSHVKVSFEQPIYTTEIDALGTLNILEAARELNKIKPVRVYQASSSEMFGASPPPQDEKTIFHPRSPYGCAKVYSYYQTINYREAYGLFACNGILFNHEGPRRGETFVTRKITRAATRIKLGLQNKLVLGNLDAKRDWGYAGDFVEAMWLMLQHDKPDDYVVATGEMHSIREFLDVAFQYLGLDWHKHVDIDPKYFRPTEVDALCGDASKARTVLGWYPKTTFEELIRMMIDSDMNLALKERIVDESEFGAH